MGLKPVPMTTDEMADLLEDMARTVRARDSFSGSIEYDALVEDEGDLQDKDYLVHGLYRSATRRGRAAPA